jgi:hypothetical protein
VAREGRGVSETLRAACKAVLSRLTTDLGAVERPGAMAASSPGAGARPKPGVLPVARPERIVTAPRAPLRNPARA